jgi:hypothetical protein
VKKYEENKPADGSPSGRQSSLVGVIHQFPQSVGFSVFSRDKSAAMGRLLWCLIPSLIKKNIGIFLQNLYVGGLIDLVPDGDPAAED